MTRVFIIESESGWGQRVDETKEFNTYAAAEKFCREYNTKYNPPTYQTPDWYMFAKIEGDSGFGMMRFENKIKEKSDKTENTRISALEIL